MTSLPWYNTAVIHEIYPRSFQDSNGDGIGDLPGIISRLDYLNDGTPQSLGVDGIWLTPIYPSPLLDFGYDISDYVDIDPMYGTLKDFDRLASEARRRNIKVIMDLVANHTSDQHAWFKESRSSRENPKRDWYVWRDGGPDGKLPNNWLSVFGGPAWTFDEATNQYYLHSFLSEQPDLNWSNPEVRGAIYDVARFWLARGVDGFRLDAIAHIGKDPEFRGQGPATKITKRFFERDYYQQEHNYDKNWHTIHPWLQELRAVIDANPTPAMLVSEIYGLSPEDVRLYHGAAGGPEMHMSFNFDVLEAGFNAREVRAAIEGFADSLPEGIWPNIVLNNHDQPRFISAQNEDGHGYERARLAAMLMLTLRGSVFLYYGEEIGMRDGEIGREELRDPIGIKYWPRPGRDPARTPMQWNTQANAGFTSGKPWLPMGPDWQEINVERERNDPTSMLSLYRRLIWLRRESPVLLYGSYEGIDTPNENVYCFRREYEGHGLVVALNFGAEPAALATAHWPVHGSLLLSTHPVAERNVGDAVALRPFEGVILE